MDAWFEHPLVLLALLGLIPFALWDGLRRWGTVRSRQLLSVALRCLLLAGIILALAQPRWEFDEQVADVVFVVDRSASIPTSLLDGAIERVEGLRSRLSSDEHAGLVLFDATPHVVVYPGDPWELPPALRTDIVDETDVGTALQVALGLIPQEHGGRIVLLTDGRVTQGSTRAAVAMAAMRGISVFVLPMDPGFTDPAVADIELESRQVRPGESIEGTVNVRSGPDPFSGHLVVRLGSEVVSDQPVQLQAGESRDVTFRYPLDPERQPGFARLQVELVPDQGQADLVSQNNTRNVGVEITDPPRVLILASNPDEVNNLRDSLQAEQMVVDVIGTTELATREFEFTDYELVYLANVPAVATQEGEAFLSAERIEELRRYVSGGGGLVTLGGDRSYELGGYGDTPLARVLPIDLQPRDPEVEPAVTMIIILDNSGSMGTWAEGGTKMDLADAAAVASMNMLRDFDSIAVSAVDDRVDWVVPLQEIGSGDRATMERQIRGIQAGGGGIYIYTSLREAYRQMRRVDTPLRHVLLFSDTADAEEQVAGIIFGWGPGPNSYDLARSMHSEGITVSVIGIGYDYDQDVTFLRTLAEAGGGRFAMTSNASELQTLFVEETQRLVESVLDESPFRVRAQLEDHPVIEGIEFRRSPRLEGYIKLEPRPTAEVVLAHPDGHPVMTVWQYGLGMVTALSIDSGARWAANWLDWDGYSVYYTQLSRWAMRRHEGDDTAIEVAFEEGAAVLRVARRSEEGLTEVEGSVRALLTEEDEAGQPLGNPLPLAMDVLEPGLWEGVLRTEPGHRYHVQIADTAGEVFAEQSFVAPPSAEFAHEGADRLGLTEIAERTGGAFDVPDARINGRLTTLTRYEPLWLYFLCGALFLMPLDAFLRRSGRDA